MNERIKTFTRREALTKTLLSITGGYTLGNTINSAVISAELSGKKREIKKLDPKLNPPLNDMPIFSTNGAISEAAIKAPATPTNVQIKEKEEAKKELKVLKEEKAKTQSELEISKERMLFGGILTAWVALFNFFIDSVNERP